ncbi:rho guanine nucleotide exchange factor 18a isoform X2 [Entelurus aequoreus]|uniref:rho guanine nucleotide exchange factor 18a isoform X2 n=1 Tax=Entelurus aequoreus TaxID=161455 RepID=UPI002B1D0655|nr:rho guanine nucleotide exchange factor 18a isoform X2 [Entelurus aequoreus]
MDEVEGLRLKHSAEDAISLASSLTESINLEDGHYSMLRAELESDSKNLEAESWSVATNPDYQRTLQRDAVKRQDVIYELIQTEMHHVRTLKILRYVYMHELRQSLLLDEGKMDMLFQGVDALLTLHQHFLSCLKLRQSCSQEEESPNGYQIMELGDILISQFSDAFGEKMKVGYSVFCGRQSEAISLYKEQMQNNKKLQSLMKKIGQLALVRRLGIPECFLLVTQRITKYPVLVERIIQNTDADTNEYQSLLQALASIKDTISQVNDCVREYEKAARLREIHVRLEPKSVGRLKDGQVFRREDLIPSNRMLLHEGPVTWKSSGRQKDVHAVLLSDVLLLLQDKDQKFVFAAVDNKPPVVSLQNLILREVAHADKAMFLICACTSEMYELHAGSREERISWMAFIRNAINQYSEEDEVHQELITRLQEYQDCLKERDDQIKQCLTEKLHIYTVLYKDLTGLDSPSKSLLLRGDPADLQRGETLLQGAIDEVENLQNLLLSKMKDSSNQHGNNDNKQGRRAEAWRGADSYLSTSSMKTHMCSDGDEAEGPSGNEMVPPYCTHLPNDAQRKELHYCESPPKKADTDQILKPMSTSPTGDLQTEVCDRVILLAQRLYTLQAFVAQQDSLIKLQHVQQSKSRPSRPSSSTLLEQEKQRNLEKHKEELASLHKLQAQQREAQQRWEKERERHRVCMETLEADLKQREDECRKHEEKVNEEKAELERQRESYQQDLERLRESNKAVEKDKERLSQEKERLEEKLKKYTMSTGHANYDDPNINLFSYQSFRGNIANGGGGSLRPHVPLATASDRNETPPKVPPRKESISLQPVKPEMPIHLISTTNQVHKASGVVQQIPTKLANLSKSKEKVFRMKPSHQRAHSAASIDVSQVLPIRVTGKEGGSLRGSHSQSVCQSGTKTYPKWTARQRLDMM